MLDRLLLLAILVFQWRNDRRGVANVRRLERLLRRQNTAEVERDRSLAVAVTEHPSAVTITGLKINDAVTVEKQP